MKTIQLFETWTVSILYLAISLTVFICSKYSHRNDLSSWNRLNDLSQLNYSYLPTPNPTEMDDDHYLEQQQLLTKAEVACRWYTLRNHGTAVIRHGEDFIKMRTSTYSCECKSYIQKVASFELRQCLLSWCVTGAITSQQRMCRSQYSAQKETRA